MSALAVDLPVQPDAPLTLEGRLEVTLTAVALADAALQSTPGAQLFPPVLAQDNRSATLVPTPEVCAGTVGFVATVAVAREPDTGVQPVELLVERAGGTFGAVTVQLASSLPDASDALLLNQTVAFAAGQAGRVTVLVHVLPDQEPELNQTFTVSLGPVTAGLATVPAARRAVQITIPENDSPRGLFQFAAVHSAPLFFNETPAANDPPGVRLDIVRTLSAQTQVTLQYTIDGDGAAQFNLPSARLIQFPAGVVAQSVFFTVRDDTVPEVDQAFNVTLLADTDDMLGPRRTAVLVIRANDDAYGVFDFAPSQVRNLSVAELPNADNAFEVNITRSAGLFGPVAVPLVSSQPEDVAALVQPVVFAAGQASRLVLVQVLNDQEPEDDEHITLSLGQPSRFPARIAPAHSPVAIRVLANDDPIGFTTVALNVSEDDGSVSLTVERGGQALTTAAVDWRVAAHPSLPGPWRLASTRRPPAR